MAGASSIFSEIIKPEDQSNERRCGGAGASDENLQFIGFYNP